MFGHFGFLGYNDLDPQQFGDVVCAARRCPVLWCAAGYEQDTGPEVNCNNRAGRNPAAASGRRFASPRFRDGRVLATSRTHTHRHQRLVLSACSGTPFTWLQFECDHIDAHAEEKTAHAIANCARYAPVFLSAANGTNLSQILMRGSDA